MFLDASAIVAVIARESDSIELANRIRAARRVHTSPVALYEAILGLARARQMTVADARTAVEEFVSQSRAQIIPITPEIGQVAIEAFERFGRGRHPARLNMGDCFAYACARSLRVPLLRKGADFPQTDIAIA
jgi:ribonuclease VapC